MERPKPSAATTAKLVHNHSAIGRANGRMPGVDDGDEDGFEVSALMGEAYPNRGENRPPARRLPDRGRA